MRNCEPGFGLDDRDDEDQGDDIPQPPAEPRDRDDELVLVPGLTTPGHWVRRCP